MAFCAVCDYSGNGNGARGDWVKSAWASIWWCSWCVILPGKPLRLLVVSMHRCRSGDGSCGQWANDEIQAKGIRSGGGVEGDGKGARVPQASLSGLCQLQPLNAVRRVSQKPQAPTQLNCAHPMLCNLARLALPEKGNCQSSPRSMLPTPGRNHQRK